MPRSCQFLLLAVVFASPLCADDAAPPPARPVPDSPIAPEATLDLFELHPDCRIELVAVEPDVIDPVHIAFDAAGRLWVVEYSDYPNGPGETEPGLSRIRVLTDDDGDGRYENPVVFADKLLFANGLMHWRDGVLVTMNGQLVFLRDTNGDGRADERQPWFSGFKIDNPQLRANHPTLGIDNHIYVAGGLRGGDVVAVRPDWVEGAEPVSLSGRDFRFDPLTGEYESISGPAQFGLTFDDWGNRFIVSNRNPCDHVVLEGRYLERNPLVAVSSVVEHVSPIAENSRVYPISRTWTTSNLHEGTFTAACGVCIYRGDAMPAAFYGNSFTCEPTGNLVHRDVLEPSGATFTSHYGREGVEFLASTDEWFRPVNLTIGPDGALYVVDMYRAVIEHPQFMPDELKDRPDLFLGTDRGRIYRIVAADAPPAAERQPALLADASGEELIEQLSHPSAWQRETAHRLLLESRDESLCETLRVTSRTAESPQARAHALWLLSSFEEVDGDLIFEVLFYDESPRVQEMAVRLAEAHDELPSRTLTEIARRAFSTDDSRLRFQILLTMSGFDLSIQHLTPAEWGEVGAEHCDDPWFGIATALAVRDDAADALIAVLKDALQQPADRQTDALNMVRLLSAVVGARGNGAEIDRVLETASAPTTISLNCVEAMAAGARRNGERLDVLVREIEDNHLSEIINSAQQAAEFQPASFAADVRIPAISLLIYDSWDNAWHTLRRIIRHDSDQAARLAALEAVRAHSQGDVGEWLLHEFQQQPREIRSGVIAAMLASKPRIMTLYSAIEAGDVPAFEIDPARARLLLNHRDPEIKSKAQELLAIATPADRQEVLARYQECLTLESDPLRGQEVFKQACVQCHRIGTLGVNVAPDISDSRTKTREELLTSILDPNRAIDNNYFSYSILDTEGIVHTGVISSETATAVTLRQPEGKEVTILRGNIEEMRSTGLSLMPVGLEEKVSPQQMADLISFVKNWRYLDGLVPEDVIR